MNVENIILSRVDNIFNPNSSYGAVLFRFSDLSDNEKYSVNFEDVYGWNIIENLSKNEFAKSVKDELAENPKRTVYFSFYKPLKTYELNENEVPFS